MRVILVFHAMLKIHPHHFVCLQALRMVFRDPTNRGDISTKSTPSPEVIHQQLLHFQSEWEEMKGIFFLQLLKEINCRLVHVDKGCISPGRGNERLHKEINSLMTSTPYGVKLSNALLKKTFLQSQ